MRISSGVTRYDPAAVGAVCPYLEFLPAPLAESALRRELVIDEIQLENGRLALGTKPGLGIELNRDALENIGCLVNGFGPIPIRVNR